MRQAQELIETIERKRAGLEDKPASRVPPPGASYKTAVLKFHLHNGTRLERLFYAHDTLQRVRDFIDVEFFDREIKIVNYELATNFPKKTYGPDMIDLTLEQVVRRLCGTMLLCVWCLLVVFVRLTVAFVF